MNRSIFFLSIKCSLITLFTFSLSVFAETDRWYALFLGGQQIGHSNHKVVTSDLGRELNIKTEMTMRRGPVEINVITKTRWKEDLQGNPLVMETETILGESKTVKKWEFANRNSFVQIIENGSSVNKVPFEIKGSWLTPLEQEEYIQARIASDAKEIRYRTLNPELSTNPINMILTRGTSKIMQVVGKPIDVIEFNHIIEGFPLKGSMVLDKKGRAVSTSTYTGMGEMKTLLAEKKEALSNIEAPELLFSLMVESNISTEKLQNATSATYRLTSSGLNAMPTCGSQKSKKADGDFFVTVNPENPVNQSEIAPDIKSTVLADHKHEEIQKMYGMFALSAPSNARGRIHALERFVFDWITKKDYSRAFATAAETAVDRTGDCTEHATLLGALLQADGIPARAAIGLVGIGSTAKATFGWHLWTQACIDGQWIDLDATRPGSIVPNHILMSTAPFEFDGMNKGMLEVINVIGDLSIEIIETS